MRGGFSRALAAGLFVTAGLAGCIASDVPAPAFQPRGFVAHYTLDTGGSMTISLEPPRPIAGPDLRIYEATMLTVDIRDGRMLTDPETGRSESPYRAVHWLDGSNRILRTDEPCIYYEDCTVNHVDWMHAGMPPPLGVAWPTLVGLDTPFYSLGQNAGLWNASWDESERRMKVETSPDLATADMVRFEGRLEYGDDLLVPIRIDGTIYNGRPMEIGAERTGVEWGAGFPAPMPWDWGARPTQPRSSWPALFDGAGEIAFDRPFTHDDTLQVLRNESPEAASILEKGGCVATYGIGLQDAAQGGADDVPGVGALYNETETNVLISLADASGARTQWGLRHYSGTAVSGERWEVGDPTEIGGKGRCQQAQAVQPRTSLDAVAAWTQTAPWGDDVDASLESVFVNRLVTNQEWLADDGLEVFYASHRPNDTASGTGVILLYSISVRASTGLANWMNLPPDRMQSLDSGEWPRLPPGS